MSVSTDSIGNEGKLSIIALFQKNLRFRFFPTQILRKNIYSFPTRNQKFYVLRVKRDISTV